MSVIVIEGIDGAGKTSAINKLRENLRKQCIDVIVFDKHKPGCLENLPPVVSKEISVIYDLIWKSDPISTENGGSNYGSFSSYLFLL